jgi:hypothetical protein
MYLDIAMSRFDVPILFNAVIQTNNKVEQRHDRSFHIRNLSRLVLHD